MGLGAGLTAVELGLRLLWPQENIYLYEYVDGYVFNRPGFDDVFAMSPTASIERLRQCLPTWLVGEAQPSPFFKERIQTNADGMRDALRPANHERRQRYRVLNLGDSIGFGWPVPLEDIYLEQLKHKLPDVETINCSLIGTHTAELVTLYQRRCGAYDADVVIVQIVVHIGTIAPDYIATDPLGPDYRLLKVLWRARTRAALVDVVWDAHGAPRLRPGALSEPSTQAVLRDYYTPRTPGYRALHALRFIENRWLTHSLNVGGGRFLEDRLRAPMDAPEGAAEHDPLAPTLRAIDELKGSVEANGARMLVLFFPTSFQARRNVLQPRADFDLLKNRLGTAATDFVDVGLLITEENLDDIYYPNDHHPTAMGHTLIAGALAERLSRDYFFDSHQGR